MSLIKNILFFKNQDQTVFTLSEIASFDASYSGKKLNSALKYLIKQKELVRIARGIYALNKNYSKFEFANKFRIPSYISFYTVLVNSGIVFQPYSSIFVASKRSEEKEIDEQKYIYRKIKDKILLNPLGIVTRKQTSIASVERAICDIIYLDGVQYFDNTRNIDFEKIELLNEKVYENNKNIKTWILQNTKQI